MRFVLTLDRRRQLGQLTNSICARNTDARRQSSAEMAERSFLLVC